MEESLADLVVRNLSVGDEVIIRPDLQRGKRYLHHNGKGDTTVSDMVNLKGRVATIVRITATGKYWLDIDPNKFSWTDGMLLPSDNERPISKDELQRVAIVALDLGDMEWYWETVQRITEMSGACV